MGGMGGGCGGGKTGQQTGEDQSHHVRGDPEHSKLVDPTKAGGTQVDDQPAPASTRRHRGC
jgi:hypothetical protein